MKTLILTEETYERMTKALGQTTDGIAVLGAFKTTHAIPSDRELVAAARNGETPSIFARRASEREAGIQAATDTREAMADLIRHAHGAGVGVTVLSRWSGLRPRRVYEILES